MKKIQLYNHYLYICVYYYAILVVALGTVLNLTNQKLIQIFP